MAVLPRSLPVFGSSKSLCPLCFRVSCFGFRFRVTGSALGLGVSGLALAKGLGRQHRLAFRELACTKRVKALDKKKPRLPYRLCDLCLDYRLPYRA